MPKNTRKPQLNQVQSTPLLESLIQLTNAELELIAGGPINIVRNGAGGHGSVDPEK
ncbi:MAG: hypothetical protein AAF215_19870 [Cyanobacteria bacterium P01_A01_bin.123]